jgi:hemerythrin superfamily protein
VGIEELAQTISNYEAHLQKQNLALNKSVENWQERLIEMLRDALLEKARDQLFGGGLTHYATEVAEHKRDPYTLIEEIVANAGKN